MPTWVNVNVLGFWVGVLSLIATFWIYYLSRRRPRMFAAYDPATIVAKAGGPVGLTYRGQTLDVHEVASCRIYIWNGGNASIRPGETLEPLSVEGHSDHALLDLKVVKTSREVIELGPVATTCFPTKRVVLDYRIIEPGDGIALDVLFTRSDKGRLLPRVCGIFEEAGDVRLFPLTYDVPQITRTVVAVAAGLFVGTFTNDAKTIPWWQIVGAGLLTFLAVWGLPHLMDHATTRMIGMQPVPRKLRKSSK